MKKVNFINRALLSFKRNKNHSIILFLIILIVSVSISTAIYISDATQASVKEIKSKLPAILSLEYKGSGISNIDKKTVEILGNSRYIDSFDYRTFFYQESDKIKRWKKNQEDEHISIHGEKNINFFTLQGVHNPNILEVLSGNKELIEGATFNNSDIENANAVALIDERLASLNSLKINDTIHLKTRDINRKESELLWKTSPNEEAISNFEIEFPVKLIGILKDKSNIIFDNQEKDAFSSIVNIIYVPNNYIYNIRKELAEIRYNKELISLDTKTSIENSQNIFDIYFKLKKADKINQFIRESEDIIPKGYEFISNQNNYKDIVTPIKNLENISFAVLVSSITISIILVSIIIVYYIRRRRREIGIYISLGEKKEKIILQFIFEIIIISILSFILSILISKFISSEISNSLLSIDKNDIIMDFDKFSSIFLKNISAEEMIDTYKINYSINTTLKSLSIIFLTMIFSSISAIIYILKIKTREMLL